MAVLGPSGRGYHHRVYTAGDVQRLLIWQERVSEVILVLESNVDIMSSLRRFYTKLCENKNFDARISCVDDVDVFTNKVDYMVDDFKLQIGRAKALVKLLGDRTELVKQHRLERLNHHMENEAVVVRIITIVTLLYLPATFASTFFSTDIIKYQGQGPGGSYSSVAMNRWLQVTIPLTVLTLIAAYALKKWEENKTFVDAPRTGGGHHGASAGDRPNQGWNWPLKKGWPSTNNRGLTGAHPLKSTKGSPLPLLPLRNQPATTGRP